MDKNDIIALHTGYFNNTNSLPLLWEPCWHNVTLEEMYQNCNKKFGKEILDKEQLFISFKTLKLN